MSKVTIHYAKVAEYIGMKTRLMKVPFSGTFELTPRCNMNCKMCYIRMTPEEMKQVGEELSLEEWLRIAEESVAAGMTMVLLTGGEALLYKDFKPFYLALRKMGVFISINTNGTVLNDSWIEFFKQYPPAKFNITLYGGCNETYARLCGNPRGFDQVKYAIEQLQANRIEILLNCTITNHNICDLEQMVAFSKEHDLQIHATTYNFPPVRKEGIEELYQARPTPTEAAEHRLLLNWYTSQTKEVFKKFIDQLCAEDYSQLQDAECQCETCEGDKIMCAAGRSNFWVTWDGRMLPCGIIPESSVSLRGRSFKDTWTEITQMAAAVRLAPACSTCKKKSLCAPCAAKLSSETGTFDQRPDYLCEYTDEYIRLVRAAKKYLEENP